jgi:hypothetical protein
MAPRRSATRPATPADARAYLAKAKEFLQASTDSLGHGNLVATAGNAVHAGIAAADAISAARAGVVWSGEHSQAANHLEKAAGADGRQAARHLRRLIPLKNQAEYDPIPMSAAAAREGHRAAERIMAIAERVVASMPSA